jgi:hypothetical protein
MQYGKKYRKTLPTYIKICSTRSKKMRNRYEFLQRILSQLENLQTSLNALRATVKEQIQNVTNEK